MEHISIIKDSNSNELKISKDFLVKLKEIVAGRIIESKINDILAAELPYYQIKVSDFSDILDEIIFKADLNVKYNCADIKGVPNYLNDIMHQEISKYNDKRHLDYKITSFDAMIERKRFSDKILKEVIYDSTFDIDSFFNSIYKIIKTNVTINKLLDLIKAYDNIKNNLELICEPSFIDQFVKEYQRAIDDHNIIRMEQLLSKAQDLILKHWENYTTPIESFKLGLPFKLICHSTSSTDFSSKFYTRFVSCSLLTPDLLETYRSGFGFVFEPKNIVGAESEDMYIVNSATSSEYLTNYSTILRIDTPEKVINGCLKQKEENRKKKIERSVYNEVVIDGFNPVALFCITDGSKELNYNYRQVHKLKKFFPNLEIIEIDKTVYEKNNPQTKMELINELECEINGNYKINIEDLSRFDMFWEEYLLLKKKQNYTEKDIILLYLKNKKMISFLIDVEDLFSGRYSVELIRYALLKGFRFNIESVMQGNVSISNLNRLYTALEIINEKDYLNSIIDGLGTFIELYPLVDIDDVIITKIKKLTPKNFNNINSILLEKIKYKSQTLKNELENYQNSAKSLTYEIKEKESLLEQIKHSESLISYEFLYNLAKKDIADIREELVHKKQEKEKIEKSQKQKQEQLHSQNKTLMALNRFKLLNLKKIEILQNEIYELTQTLKNNDSIINHLNDNITYLQQQLKELEDNFYVYVNTTLDDYPNKLTKAKKIIADNNEWYVYWSLYTLRERLEQINQRITELEKQIKQIGGVRL